MTRWLLFCCAAAALGQSVRPADLVKLASRPPDATSNYGSGPRQFGELRLPAGKGPHPVAVVIHGGCWGEFADLGIMSNFAARLAEEGLAAWNIEYRRVHEPGGEWPATFLDTGAAIDHLRVLAKKHSLDLTRVVVTGHSAGGHLALWAAGRHRIRDGSPLRTADPLRIKAAVSIAGPPDMAAFSEYGQKVCGERHWKAMGGKPGEVPDHYRDGSPAALLPLGVPQTLLYGAKDRAIPPSLFASYTDAAKKGGQRVEVKIFEESGHFELLMPGRPEFEQTVAAIVAAAR